MNLSPEQWAEVRDAAARMIKEEAMESMGGIEALIVLPIQTVTQLTGVSRHTIPQVMKVTRTCEGKEGVTLRNLRSYVETRTSEPGKKAKKTPAPTPTA